MFGDATRALGNLLSWAISIGDETFWLPRRGSSLAADVDFNFGLVYWISVFFFALVTFLMVFFAVRYRQRPGQKPEKAATHNTPLEVLWSVIPTLIVIGLFWSGYKTYLNMTIPPQNTYEVLVTGQKWNWTFTYPNGYIDAQLHVPIDTPVKLTMTSEDVIHSFYVPDFRIKRDVVPGRYTRVWFTAIETGEYDIFCTEYCGTNHWNMLSKLVVHERADFDAWLEEASDFLSKMPPAEAGEMLYNMRGCKQCHSVDGSPGTGPSFLGKFGSEEKMLTGETVLVEENYIRESILNPQARVVAGYDPVMPTYQGRLKDEEITAIIEYMKTLSDQ
jgi:cytochrome c oxidase subunit 2